MPCEETQGRVTALSEHGKPDLTVANSRVAAGVAEEDVCEVLLDLGFLEKLDFGICAVDVLRGMR